MDLVIEPQPTGGSAVFHLTGQLDLLSTTEVKQRLVQAVSEGLVCLVINLADVTFIDSAGLAALISGLKAARQGGGDLRLACPGREVETILEFTRLDRVIQIYATVGEALASYAPGEDGGA